MRSLAGAVVEVKVYVPQGDLGRTVGDRIRHDVRIETPSELVSSPSANDH